MVPGMGDGVVWAYGIEVLLVMGINRIYLIGRTKYKTLLIIDTGNRSNPGIVRTLLESLIESELTEEPGRLRLHGVENVTAWA